MFSETTATGVLEMHGSKTYTEHANLVDRVAYKVGVDFDKAVQRGDLLPEQVLESMFRCLICTQSDLCAEWLDTDTDGDGGIPAYCRNGALIEKLVQIERLNRR